ncbi:MAG: glycosyltransferase [Acidimicrobiia bacterium]
MRILFISGTVTGGSAHSTRELAEHLTGHGHGVAVLSRVDGDEVRSVHRRAANLVSKLSTSSVAGRVDRVTSMVGRKPRRSKQPVPYEAWESVVPENSLRFLIQSFGPDVVVASTVERAAWTQIRQILTALGIPSVLYVREESALDHLRSADSPPDLLLAGSHAFAARAAQLGYPALVIPSVVSVDRYLVESSRERVLFINPVRSFGLETALELAAARPDVRFAFVEWWKIDDAERAALDARLAAKLPNVVLRPATADPAAIYADARVLLTPFLVDRWPRVVLEAQANGIPVLGRDLPALHEAIGSGGRLVPADAVAGEWTAALGDLIDDPDRYREACDAARAHAAREEVDPGVIVSRFERALAELVAGSRDPSIGPVDSSGTPRP